MKILLTSGVGDFWAMMSFTSQYEKNQIDEIYWATRQRKVLEPFMNLFFPNLKTQYVLCDDFTKSEELNADPMNTVLRDRFCVHSIDDLFNRFPVKFVPPDRHLIQDWSTTKIASQAVSGQRNYVGIPEILDRRFVNIDHFNLPDKYVVLVPWSDNQRYEGRDLFLPECIAVTKHLERRGLQGIVLNISNEFWPVKSPYITDLTNKTTIFEAIEILKASSGYIGTSSSLSVIATKCLPSEEVHIKCPESLASYWYKFYYEPYKNTFSFHRNLEFLK